MIGACKLEHIADGSWSELEHEIVLIKICNQFNVANVLTQVTVSKER